VAVNNSATPTWTKHGSHTARDLAPAGTWVGTTLSNLWLWFGL